jgi:hypothetical protein
VTVEQDMINFLEEQLNERAAQAAAMRQSSTAGHWLGIDPAEVAADLEQPVAAGRRAVELYRSGQASDLLLRCWALSFANRPGYRDEWC